MKAKQNQIKHQTRKSLDNFFKLSVRQRVVAGISGVLIIISMFAMLLQANIVIPTFTVQLPGEIVLAKAKEPEKPTQILFVGDIMLDRGVLSRIRANNADYSFPFQYVADFFHTYDYVVANLEGPVSDQGTLLGSKYSFRFSPEVAQALATAGVDLVSMANNHIFDYGRDALCDTPIHLREAGVEAVGAGCDELLANTPVITTIGDTPVMFLAYTNLYPNGLTATGQTPGVSDLNFERISEHIEEFKTTVNEGVVVALMHWGDEYESYSHPRERVLAEHLAGLGVDAVIGHHPHVTQEIQRIGDTWVVYSLGNFIFDQYFSKETMQGYAVALTLGEGAITATEILPYDLNDRYQPIFRGQQK